MNNHPICTSCGTQFSAAGQLPELCPICDDDRQFINPQGQAWTNLDQLKKDYHIKIAKIDERLYTLKMEPDFAIGQRAFLVTSQGGNVLWDCIPLTDGPTIDFIKSQGGLKAIAISHPHFYSTMNEWAQIFDCPVYIHSADSEFVHNYSTSIRLWKGGEQPLWDDMRIIHAGGHFPGSSMLHITRLSAGGAMLCGDTLYISRSKRHTAVMFSYPNQILLTRDEFKAMHERCAGLSFDTLYGASFDGQELKDHAHDVFAASMKKYIENYQL